jgi:hypothetical protein
VKPAFLFLLVFDLSATADLTVWNSGDISCELKLDSTGTSLVIYSQYAGWGYFDSMVLVASDTQALPDSFSVFQGEIVSDSDSSGLIDTGGNVQVLERYPEIELDEVRSNLPDTLCLICIATPFSSEPDTSIRIWTLIGDSYELLPCGSIK